MAAVPHSTVRHQIRCSLRARTSQTQTFNSVGSSVGRTDSRVGNGSVERRRKNSSAANRSSSVKTERGQSAAINKNHERNNGKKHGKKKSSLPKWLLLPDSGAEEGIIRIKGSFDRPMLIIVLALIGFGLITGIQCKLRLCTVQNRRQSVLYQASAALCIAAVS